MNATNKKYVKYALIAGGVIVLVKILDDAAVATGNSAGKGVGDAVGTVATGAVVIGGGWAFFNYVWPLILL